MLYRFTGGGRFRKGERVKDDSWEGRGSWEGDEEEAGISVELRVTAL